jgi:hypothetical protein
MTEFHYKDYKIGIHNGSPEVQSKAFARMVFNLKYAGILGFSLRLLERLGLAFVILVILLHDHMILQKSQWNCFEHTKGQCTAYNYKGE